MSAISLSLPPALAHAVWRANQVGVYQGAASSSGYPVLDAALPQSGWPSGALIELLLQQSGIGELRLLQPALEAIARRRSVVLVQPPCLPQAAAWQGWGLPPQQLLWIRTQQTADALWSAEQVLRNGSCGALLLWQQQVRPEAL
ncbi:MAG: translesion DNA synthesis-associated protein ImuA, partial [Lacisediminimonas sp.]|nr:translesion DNA synthesis-associated protein ImuA [Lacisediminimonas sp.]